MKDQQNLWENVFSKQIISSKPSVFCEEVIKIIPPKCVILELGCGNGKDAAEFANHHHKVTAIDFSQTVIENNKEIFTNVLRIHWAVGDISNLQLEQNSFDVIYSHLALHYFTDEVTRKIISDCNKLLKKGGLLCFVCKSVNDPLYGKGIFIEKDMYELDGHVRHFFSEEYCKSILGKAFKVISIKSGDTKFYDSPSSYVEVIAEKI